MCPTHSQWRCIRGITHRASCRTLGRRLALGLEVGRDLVRASALLRHACNLGDAPACRLRAEFRCLNPKRFDYTSCDAPALFYVERARELESGDPQTLDVLARIACILGMRDRAREAWAEAGVSKVCPGADSR